MDITAASDVVFFAPVARRLEDLGHTVTITARRFESGDLLLRRYGLAALLAGRHRGGGLGARAVGLANRTRQLLGSALDRRFDVATGAHTTDFLVTCSALGIPRLTFLDEEALGPAAAARMALAGRVAMPEALAATEQVRRLGGDVLAYPGFREEYYLHDVQPDPLALRRLAVDRRHVTGVVRPAASARCRQAGCDRPREDRLAAVVAGLSQRRGLTLVLLARDREQRQRYLAGGRRNLVAPDVFADGIGLLAAADFVLADGGLMVREAAALGTPAYTIGDAGRLGAVDRRLVLEGRLRLVRAPDDVVLRKKDRQVAESRPRDPQLFVEELLGLARRAGRPGSSRAGRALR